VAVISRQEVEHIARLSCLAFEPDELNRFTAQLNRILEYVARLEALDTSLAAPTSSVLADRSTPLRDDEPCEGLTREEALEPAPAQEGGLFKVPRIIE
jgi:aspartyl-tRNA(Asn)/glutamyl-tRNA(Gln) amidotransferase subunit C